MSDTPRTDEVFANYLGRSLPGAYNAMTTLSRLLERELAALRAELAIAVGGCDKNAAQCELSNMAAEQFRAERDAALAQVAEFMGACRETVTLLSDIHCDGSGREVFPPSDSWECDLFPRLEKSLVKLKTLIGETP